MVRTKSPEKNGQTLDVAPKHRTEPLSREFVAERRTDLQKQLGRLTGRSMEEMSGYSGSDVIEVAAAATDASLEAELQAHGNERTREILAALQRIRRGVYGECTKCMLGIPESRLEALPEAAQCMDCQLGKEAKKVVRHRPAKIEFEERTQRTEDDTGHKMPTIDDLQ
jgi:DnaK suppressor protein